MKTKKPASVILDEFEKNLEHDFEVEIYSDKRKAEFLLNNAIDENEYLYAIEEVKKMGLNPKEIPHKKYF